MSQPNTEEVIIVDDSVEQSVEFSGSKYVSNGPYFYVEDAKGDLVKYICNGCILIQDSKERIIEHTN